MAECGEKRPKLTIPHCPSDVDDTGSEPINTLDLKYVADYVGVNIVQVEDLDILTFFALLHDAIVYQLSQTSDGREYLDSCRRMRQTEPDIAGIRMLKGGGSHG